MDKTRRLLQYRAELRTMCSVRNRLEQLAADDALLVSAWENQNSACRAMEARINRLKQRMDKEKEAA